MKQIAVIANEKEYAKYLRENLMAYFSKHAIIRAYSTEEIQIMESIEENYVVISAFTIFHKVKQKIHENSELIVIGITLNKKYIKGLDGIPKNTRALLVNMDYNHCVQVIAMIYSAGYKNLELIPYYPGIEDYDKTIQLAITPGESVFLPPNIKQVIDIGERVIDLNCILHIADKLEIKDIFKTTEAIAARNNVAFGNVSIEKVLGENESLSERVNVLIKMMQQGIVITDRMGKIYSCNDKAEQLLKNRTDLLTGFNISELVPEIDFVDSTFLNHEHKEQLIHIDGIDIIATVTPIIKGETTSGNVIVLDNFEEVEEKQHSIRAKLSESNHVARYGFESIIGNSDVIRGVIATAKRMAKSEASILIMGESGTGKEVFAQSIHNGSSREKYNFVAVNCAAIPENLLESEMFGYEEGSFTGAKKGGKIGFFELAHKGTIFLDEIAELPMQLQSKLLRVIEEKKISRVGSKRLIAIDVRIIAATNQDLNKLIEEQKFREDLYYRLNVLPLYLPSLRERKEDILLLIEHFKKMQNEKFILDEKVSLVLEEHLWKGNIRELRNVVEYLSSLEKEVIEKDDLPLKHPPLRDKMVKKKREEPNQVNRFLLREGSRGECYLFILECMDRAQQRKERIGRAKLAEYAQEKGLFYTEQEIRYCLNRLDSYGFIHTMKGRAGSTVNDWGLQLKERLKGLIG